MYAYAFLDEFVLLYPLYTLLFARTGLSTGQISSLFVIWSLTTLVLEVPAGAWADAVSRRLLLCLGPLLGALGFGLWVAAPGYPAFAAGFVLWGAKGALVSGSLEALVYEGLAAEGRDFTRVWGRAQGAGLVAVVLATVLASPVVATGGYAAVGAASVAAGVAGALVALALPDRRSPGPDEGEVGFVETLRAGWQLVRVDADVGRAMLLVPAVTAIYLALEEYTPLLAAAGGASDAEVPWWQAVVWVGMTAGGLLAARFSGLGRRGLALIVATAAAGVVAGALSGRPSGLVVVAVAFGLLQVGSVLAQARLQDAVTGSARATVTSLASLADELGALPVYLGYGWLAGAGGDGLAFAVLALPYLAVAVWIAHGDAGRRRPRRE